MIGVLILGQKDFAEGLIRAVEHMFGARPAAIEAVGIDYSQPPERMIGVIRSHLAHVDQGDGVLILADIFGCTHTNVARHLLKPGRVELISGASLPMVLRALTYRELKMDELIERALAGGFNGIICASVPEKQTKHKGKTRR
jgi:mannose PTS system EIIA component